MKTNLKYIINYNKMSYILYYDMIYKGGRYHGKSNEPIKLLSVAQAWVDNLNTRYGSGTHWFKSV